MQTLAQAHKFCHGEVPPRHNDVIYPYCPYLESNIIFNTEGLFYLTFSPNELIPLGYRFFCTVQEFIDFVPPVELFDGKAYQFDCGCGIGIHGVLDKASNCLYDSKNCAYPCCDITNIEPLTIDKK
jgi:hypothetical protein